MRKGKKRYVIAKVVENGTVKVVKYRSDNLPSLVRFLERKFDRWMWLNVYDKDTRSQIGSFTVNNKPVKHI